MNRTSRVQRARDSQSPVEWVEEENYMFRLSRFTSRIRAWLHDAGECLLLRLASIGIRRDPTSALSPARVAMRDE